MVDARGSVGDTVFSIWKGIHYIRSRIVPSNPQTDLQTAQREALAHSLTMWQSVKTWAKAVWNHYATGYAKSGYNRYIEDNILLVKAAVAGVLTPFNAAYIKVSAMAATQGGAGEIACSWVNDTGVGGTDQLAFYTRKTETGDEAYAWTSHGNCAPEAEFFTLAGLDTGEEYEVGFFCKTIIAGTAQMSHNELLLAG